MSERVKDDYRVTPRVAPTRARERRQRRRPSLSFPLALGLTVIGTLLPGVGLILAGLRRIGIVIASLFALLAIGVGYLALAQQQAIMHWAVQADTLLVIGIVLPVIGLAWVSVIVATYRAARPRHASLLQRSLGSLLVAVLALTVLLPLAVSGRYAQVQKGVVEHVFASEDSKSATRPKNVTRQDPWAGQDRVNVLLLGGDGGKGRIGVRPDSLQVASIDTHTGDTVLFSLPRNLEKVPFPPGSVLADVYPNGVFDGEGDRLEWMLNAIYEERPAAAPAAPRQRQPGRGRHQARRGRGPRHPARLLRPDQPRGLHRTRRRARRHHRQCQHQGGDRRRDRPGRPPKGWIEPGAEQHLDGYHALWFARGRYGSDDYQRMERQRCTMNAIIDQADPGKVLTRYESIAQTSKNIVFTDIPGALLPAFVDLSMKVKGADVTSIAFTNKIIKAWDPDYPLIRSMVRKAVQASERAANTDTAAPKPTPAKTRTATPTPTATDDGPAPTASPTPSRAADSLDDACAYAPVD